MSKEPDAHAERDRRLLLAALEKAQIEEHETACETVSQSSNRRTNCSCDVLDKLRRGHGSVPGY